MYKQDLGYRCERQTQTVKQYRYLFFLWRMPSHFADKLVSAITAKIALLMIPEPILDNPG
jgi:hypothetical protein